MKEISQFICFCLLTSILYSCQSSKPSFKTGPWDIDFIRYKRINLRYQMTGSSISIANNELWIVPTIFRFDEDNSAREAKPDYFRIKDVQYIYFDTTNEYFNDTFELRITNRDSFYILNRDKLAMFSNIASRIKEFHRVED